MEIRKVFLPKVPRYVKNLPQQVAIAALFSKCLPPPFVRQHLNLKHSERMGKFAKENNLKVRDACVFELIDGLKNLFRVVIRRSDESGNENCSFSRVLTRNLEDEVKEET
ncbi:hypothetical protein ACFE04_027412 [Oxalis oulophora]